jgi:hypothetical protein
MAVCRVPGHTAGNIISVIWFSRIDIKTYRGKKGFLMMKTQVKSGTPKATLSALQFLVVGLLIFMWTSNLAAENEVSQKNNALDLFNTTSGIDQTNLIEKSKIYDFKEHLPNIIKGPGKTEDSKGNSSLIFAYIILGLFACLFVFYVIYTILDFWVLSRREWKQRVGEPEHEQHLNSLPNSSVQTHTEATKRTDVVSF